MASSHTYDGVSPKDRPYLTYPTGGGLHVIRLICEYYILFHVLSLGMVHTTTDKRGRNSCSTTVEQLFNRSGTVVPIGMERVWQ